MAKLNGFRKFIKWYKEADGFRKASVWTSSQSVERPNGATVETDLSAVIKGLADHISNTSNLSKEDFGLGNVDNTADKDKSVKYAVTAGSANSVSWANVSGKPSTFTPSSHTHDDRYFTETEINSMLSGYVKATLSFDASTNTLNINT